MNRSTLLALGVVSILGVSACSDGNKLSVTSSKQTGSTAADSGTSTGDSSGSASGSGDTTDGSASLPDLSGAGLSANCTAYLTAIASAFTPNAEGAASLADSFSALEKEVPDNLKGDVRVLADGFAKLQKLYKKYNYDYSKIATDPEAATLFSDKAFADASTNVSTWLDKECAAG